MSANALKPNDTPPASRWRLWIDGCGGYLLLTGNRWTLGGVSEKCQADILVRADMARQAGTLERRAGDYFWQRIGDSHRAELIPNGQVIGMESSARLVLHQPSALCDTATLTLNPPHRFDEHVDAILLVNETILVGPTADCHIRCRTSSDRVVLMRKGEQWMAKLGPTGESTRLQAGERTVVGTLAMTLEEA